MTVDREEALRNAATWRRTASMHARLAHSALKPGLRVYHEQQRHEAQLRAIAWSDRAQGRTG